MIQPLVLSSSFSDVVEFQKRYLTNNDVYIDVGANDGSTTLFAMKQNPLHCYLIEACPYFDEYLPERIKALAPNDRYTIIKKLSLDFTGSRTLYYPDLSPSQSSIYDRFTRNNASVHPVILPTTTIDDIVKDFHINNPIVMKIDTELSESLVWKGMKKSLPIIRDIFMEFYSGALEQDAKINPRLFLEEIQDDGFSINDVGGEQLPISEALAEGRKTDIYLKNTRYGYID